MEIKVFGVRTVVEEGTAGIVASEEAVAPVARLNVTALGYSGVLELPFASQPMADRAVERILEAEAKTKAKIASDEVSDAAEEKPPRVKILCYDEAGKVAKVREGQGIIYFIIQEAEEVGDTGKLTAGTGVFGDIPGELLLRGVKNIQAMVTQIIFRD